MNMKWKICYQPLGGFAQKTVALFDDKVNAMICRDALEVRYPADTWTIEENDEEIV